MVFIKLTLPTTLSIRLICLIFFTFLSIALNLRNKIKIPIILILWNLFGREFYLSIPDHDINDKFILAIENFNFLNLEGKHIYFFKKMKFNNMNQRDLHVFYGYKVMGW